MRLLNAVTLQLEAFPNATSPKTPPYAILSHTWGDEGEEVQYHHLMSRDAQHHIQKSAKLQGLCEHARSNNQRYVWVDSCCINQTSSAELTEAINSMFRWYKEAEVCYTYIADVTVADGDNESQVHAKLERSRWFTRGWTLQELLAPEKLHFFDSKWRFLGTKGTLCDVVESATGISHEYLQCNRPISTASVGQRMSWAARRVTTKDEDMAYCLLGIFDVNMPAIPGEGRERAFRRLQKEILEQIIDDDSILAWDWTTDGPPTPSIPVGFLAPSPAAFINCQDIVARPNAGKLKLSPGVVQLPLRIHSASEDKLYGILSSGHENNSQHVVGVPLMKSTRISGGYARPKGGRSLLIPRTTIDFASPEELIELSIVDEDVPAVSSHTGYWILARVPPGGDFARPQKETVEPSDRYDENKGSINVGILRDSESPSITFVRYNRVAAVPTPTASDFIVALEPKSRPEAQEEDTKPTLHCSIMRCDRSTTLKDVAGAFSNFRQSAQGCQAAGDGQVTMMVMAQLAPSGKTFVLQPQIVVKPTAVGICATTQLALSRVKTHTSNFESQVKKWQREVSSLEEHRLLLASDRQRAQNRLTELEETVRQLEEQLRATEAKVAETKAEIEGIDSSDVQASEEQSSQHQTLLNLRHRFSSKLGQVNHRALDKLTTAMMEEDDLHLSPECSLASYGYTSAVESVSRLGLPAPTSKEGRTTLCFAASAGHLDIVRLLLARGYGDPQSVDNHGRTAVQYAAWAGRTAIVEALVDWHQTKPDLDGLTRPDRDGVTPLITAAYHGNTATIAALLKLPPEFDKLRYLRVKDKISVYTALEYAAGLGHTSIVEMLLVAEKDASGASFDPGDNNGNKMLASALASAIARGQLDMVKLLLPRMSEEGLEGENVLSALRTAKYRGHESVVDFVKDKIPGFAQFQTKTPVSAGELSAVDEGRKEARDSVPTSITRRKHSGDGSNQERFFSPTTMPGRERAGVLEGVNGRDISSNMGKRFLQRLSRK